MKQIVSFHIVSLIVCSLLFGLTLEAQQNCPEVDANGIIVFRTQAQIDNYGTVCGFSKPYWHSVGISGADITNLNGLSGITSVDFLGFGDCPLLTDISGLNGITSISGDLRIGNNPLLTNYSFNALTAIGGGLNIQQNSAPTISGFNALKSVTVIYINTNPLLTSIGGFNALTTTGYILIGTNHSLTSISGFNALTAITNSSGGFTVYDNASLTTLSGFNALKTINGSFCILSNPALTTITDFNALTSCGKFKIQTNPALTTISGFGALTNVTGEFTIFESAALTNLLNFSALTNVNGILQISNNNILTNLNGLNNITPSSITSIYITNNAQPSACAIKSTCCYLQMGSKPYIISGNLSGCNSSNEILTVCTAVGLPIDLISFAAKNVGTYNVLNWLTANETNNTGFDIERSNSGNSFEKIGFVRGAVNSSSVQNYTFTDENPLQVGNYYRLKQIDIDGKFTYSNIIEVQNQNVGAFGVSPNPSSDKIYVSSIKKNSAFSITNVQGQTIKMGVFNNAEGINITDLQQGLYFLRTASQTAKFVKQNAY